MDKSDLFRLRRDKRDPCADFWHTVRIGLILAVPLTLVAIFFAHEVMP